jgi:fructosamine-3-kinase
MARTPKPFVARVAEVKWLRNTQAGNPRAIVKFDDGRIHQIADDHSVGWDVDNALGDQIPRAVTLTSAGRIAHWEERP